MKKVVYTAITNDYDELQDPVVVDPDVDYICFTDDPTLQSDVWQIVLLPGQELREDKKVKIMPHLFLEDYDQSLWVDANFIIRRELSVFMDLALRYDDHAVFRHPFRRASLKEEVEECIKLRKDKAKVLRNQLSVYYKEFLPSDYSVVNNSIIIRNHNKPAVKQVMEDWWQQLMKHSMRDQVSFPYVAVKHGYQYNIIRMDSRDNKWFGKRKHRSK